MKIQNCYFPFWSTWCLASLFLSAAANAQIQFASPSAIPTFRSLTQIISIDIDLDGDLDLINRASRDAQILLNQGGRQSGSAGEFSGLTTFITAQEGFRHLAVADLNNDNLPDLVLLEPQQIRFLINLGFVSGRLTFEERGISLDGMANSVDAADVDGDGNVDLALSRMNQSQIMLGDGNGNFSPAQLLGSGNNVVLVKLVDLDRDGDPDLLTGGDTLTLWVNQGGNQAGQPGQFLPSAPIVSVSGVIALAVGDLDADAETDVVIVDSLGLRRLFNRRFPGLPTRLVVDRNPVATGNLLGLALADIDQDLDLDIVVARSGPNQLLLNQGGTQDGAPGVLVDSGLALGNSDTRGLALGDLNSDGLPDIVDADATQTASVQLNQSQVTNPVNPAGWQTDVAMTRGNVGIAPSVAVDELGRVHVAHLKIAVRTDISGTDGSLISKSEMSLVYSRFDGVFWVHQTVRRLAVDGSRLSSGTTQLVLDSTGLPHIVVIDESEDREDQVVYLHLDGAGWSSEIVHQSLNLDRPAIALTPNNAPEMVFTDNGSLQHARQNGGIWSLTDLGFTTSATTHEATINIDSDFRTHIVFVSSDSALIYLQRTGDAVLSQQLASGLSNKPFDATLDLSDNLLVLYSTDESLVLLTLANRKVQRETVSSFEADRLKIRVDESGGQHLVFYDFAQLRYGIRTGQFFLFSVVDSSRSIAGFDRDQILSLAMAPGNIPTVAYYDSRPRDLRVSSLQPRWRELTVSVQDGQSPDIALHGQTRPLISHFDTNSSIVRSHNRSQDQWTSLDIVGSSGSPPGTNLLISSTTDQYAAVFEPSGSRLVYANGAEGQSWQVQVLDDDGDTGRQVQLLNPPFASSNQFRAVYWDATAGQIKMARFRSDQPQLASFALHSNTPAGVNIDEAALSSVVSRDDRIFVSYYHQSAGELRLAEVDNQDSWTDTLTLAVNPGQTLRHSLALDIAGVLALVVHDESLNSIRYGTRSASGGGWSFSTAAAGVQHVGKLQLMLAENQWRYPRIIYTDLDRRQIRSLDLHGDLWQDEAVRVFGDFVPDVAAVTGRRMHLAATRLNNDLKYLARAATLDLPRAAEEDRYAVTQANPITACIVFLQSIEGISLKQAVTPVIPQGLPATLGDQDALQGAYPAWNSRSGTRRYIDLLLTHGEEMSTIALADPQLQADVESLVQNMLPGLEAIALGRGDEVGISQELMTDALSMWQRLADRGSAALREVIELELARYNNLDKFVGQSWSGALYLAHDRSLLSDGFE